MRQHHIDLALWHHGVYLEYCELIEQGVLLEAHPQ